MNETPSTIAPWSSRRIRDRRIRDRLIVTAAILAAMVAASSTAASGEARAVAITAPSPLCDMQPTGVAESDYSLHFKVPPGLMPDPQFDGRPAKLEVHRVRPVYAHGKCPLVPSRAAVLIHGRTVAGPVAFDLRHPAPEGGELSVQRALAQAGIDTFAPSLLGYGRSTRFDEGLKDPGNASLRPYPANGGSCPNSEGCDRTHVPVFPLDQQGTLLLTNPLGGERRPHSSSVRFARVDTFVRDIRQVIDDAIERARPTDGRVTLIGYSAGGQHVARTLYPANPVLPDSVQYIAKVNRAVFVSSLFGFPTEETPPPAGFATFPLHVFEPGSRGAWQMPTGREAVCTGHTVPGSVDRHAEQILQLETVAREWGGTDPDKPTGLGSSPTFSSYGWNTAVARTLITPALVIHGLDDTTAPLANAPAIYDNLTLPLKVLVQVGCASHAMLAEGCSGQRCRPASGVPYGGRPGQPWAGPHATTKAALIEWINTGTFNGTPSGRFVINDSGVVEGGLALENLPGAVLGLLPAAR